MVKLENINFGYTSKKLLLEKLSLQAAPGSIHGLLGKNGAGKTSLLKLISGLRKPNSGDINVLEHTPNERKMSFCEQLYFVPEELYVPSMSANLFVKLYSGYYPNFNHEKFSNYLKSFDLDSNMHLGRVSFGQKKKFILAFALAACTPLVLFDEPTNGLDIPSKSIFRKLAASAINDDRCFIISTHQVRDLNMLLDSVMLIDKGQMIINSSLLSIANKYSFVTLPRQNGQKDILYSEEHIDGIKAIIPFDEKFETEVDLELLFNAAVIGKVDF